MAGMKRMAIMIGLAVLFAGCASKQSRWDRIEIGQTKADALDAMGSPDHIQLTKKGNYLYGWNFTPYSGCGVVVDDSDKIIKKDCISNPIAQARYQSATMAYMRGMGAVNQQIQQSNYSSAQNYQRTMIQNRPVQTNCTTNVMGGIARTSCSSAATGIDASIYGR